MITLITKPLIFCKNYILMDIFVIMGDISREKGEPFDKKEKFSILGITNPHYCRHHIHINKNFIFI